ncbi:MAG: glycoside hydrolase family 88 protein [Opitutaceae bacterium]
MERRPGVPGLAIATVLLVAAARLDGQPSQTAIHPRDVLSVMERVADWQLSNPSKHAPNDWTQAAGDAGFMALAGISGNARYRDAMVAAGEANHWQLGPRFYHADDHCIGQTYAELYLLYREPKMIEALRSRFDSILGKPSGVSSLDFGQPYAVASEKWSWCDALFMAPPAWMRLYGATGDPRYADFAVKNWWLTTDYLYDKDEHLFFRDSSYFRRREANGRKIFWSRGNGWVMAGLVRVLQFLPANHPDRARFERLLVDMSSAVLACQQGDGLWRASLLDPGDYPMRETSGSGFYTYALAWGVNQGLLDRARFEPAVLRAWAALVACVGPDGKLSRVQPIGADPKKFDESSTEVYGVGAFLLAGSEVFRMAVLGAGPSSGARGSVLAVVRVTNTASFHREEETVELDPRPFGSISGAAVMDGMSSRILASQAYATQPGSPPDRLLFQVDLAPGETRQFYVLDSGAGLPGAPAPIVKTFARQVPERFNDVAWESDRIAHRTYSQDLIKGEGTISSGIDVWTKRTRALVVDEWYQRKNYHEDDGDGLDDYEVGRSRGCGGLGVWKDGKLYTSSNFRQAKIITTGPVRSEFELTFDAWDVAGRMVSETKRISIDAGSNMSRVSSTFRSNDPSPIEIAIGIAQRADPRCVATRNPESGWVTYWQAPDRDRGSIGCAVVLGPGAIKGFAMEEASVPTVPPEKRLLPGSEGLHPVGNLLALARAEVGAPLVYYLGAGWSRSGDFPSELAWNAYVARFAERRLSPLNVIVTRANVAKN